MRLAILAALLAVGQARAMAVAPDLQRRLGVRTEALTAERRKAEVDAFAKVLDPGPLAQLDSDLMTAVAAAAASRPEAERTRALHAAGDTVSAKDTEAAQSQARQDAAKVALLRARLGLEWGPGIARLSDSARERLIVGLSKGTIALVHVDTPSNAGQAGARTVKVDLGDGSVSVPGVVLGPARQAEPRLQSSGLLVEVTGPQAILLSIGLTNSAHIETGAPQPGVLIKREALIRYRGSTWAYVQHGEGQFERRLVQDGEPEDGGVFVASGFSPGDRVVTGGAAGLFAAELSQAK
jgi:hypothetical protein